MSHAYGNDAIILDFGHGCKGAEYKAVWTRLSVVSDKSCQSWEYLSKQMLLSDRCSLYLPYTACIKKKIKGKTHEDDIVN